MLLANRRHAIVSVLTAIALAVSPVVDVAAQEPSHTLVPNVAAPSINAEDITSSLSPLDTLGRPKQPLLDQARQFANTVPMHPKIRAAILAGVAFYEGSGTSPVDLPENAPTFTQFYWPTVAGRCINGSLDAVGSGIAVPGPATIPEPGANDGETAFLFTALGTGAVQDSSMRVLWFNLDTLTNGTVELADHGINPEGPATISGSAPTGKGRIVAVMDGSVDTIEQESTAHCSFIPTAAFFEVK